MISKSNFQPKRKLQYCFSAVLIHSLSSTRLLTLAGNGMWAFAWDRPCCFWLSHLHCLICCLNKRVLRLIFLKTPNSFVFGNLVFVLFIYNSSKHCQNFFSANIWVIKKNQSSIHPQSPIDLDYLRIYNYMILYCIYNNDALLYLQ